MNRQEEMAMLSELQENYGRHGVVLFFGELTPEKAEHIRFWLMRLSLQYQGTQIKLIIDSRGGSVHHGLMLVDLIQSLPKQVIGIVNGECHSMAPVVLQACSERIATKHSRFLLHNISYSPRYSLFDAQARFDSDYKNLKRYQGQIIDILCGRSGLPPEKVIELITGGDVVEELHSSDMICELKLVDRVVEKFEMLGSIKKNKISVRKSRK